MTEAEYKKTQGKVVQIARAVEDLDLSGMLLAIGRAEAVAPILDPTLYRKACDNMRAIKKLVQSLQPVQAAAAELRLAVIAAGEYGDMKFQD
jgi:hypothetical protein